MPSRAALISGRFGISNGVVTHGADGQTLASPRSSRRWDGNRAAYRTLPELLFDDRIETAAVSSFPRHPAPWFSQDWETFRHPREPEGDGEYFQTVRAEAVAERVLETLDELDDDGLLYAQFWDPHTPYNRDSERVERFDDGRAPPYPTADQIADQQGDDSWRAAGTEGIGNRDDLRRVIAQYDAEINYVDEVLGRVFDTLRNQGRYEESLVIVTADHGEEFGEHGLYREHWNVHDATQRVPLLVKPPADATVDTGERDALVENVDIAPTVVDYFGCETPSGWQGTSLRPLVEDDRAERRDYIVFDHGLYTAQRAVRTDRWKYVKTYNDGIWSLPDEQLFEMPEDPYEQTDVADAHPDVVTDLRERMTVWAEAHAGPLEDPLKAVARRGPAGLRWT